MVPGFECIMIRIFVVTIVVHVIIIIEIIFIIVTVIVQIAGPLVSVHDTE